MNITITDLIYVLRGTSITVGLCLCAMLAGMIIGFIFGIMRASKIRILKGISWFYIYTVRGTPLLMQLFLVYYGLPLLTGYSIPAFVTAVLGLTLYTGAYLAEIVKAGLLAIDSGQSEAAKALGMTKIQEFIKIILPQALKIIIPPGAGFFIALIKDSSLVSAIGFTELTRAGKLIIARTFTPFSIYMIIAIIYFIISYSLSIYSKKLEKTLGENNE